MNIKDIAIDLVAFHKEIDDIKIFVEQAKLKFPELSERELELSNAIISEVLDIVKSIMTEIIESNGTQRIN